jgi:hypothetical protein
MTAEFIRIWLTWTGMVLGAAVVAAIWAARAGHFRDQERARRLALWAEVEAPSTTARNRVPSPLVGEDQGGGEPAGSPSPSPPPIQGGGKSDETGRRH